MGGNKQGFMSCPVGQDFFIYATQIYAVNANIIQELKK